MRINPISSLYDDFIKILNSAVIKYSYLAEKYESLAIRKKSDGYLDAVYERDNFYTYTDYTEEEMRAVGMISESDILNGINDFTTIPKKFQPALLANRRASVIANYVEENSYYRMLNGLPDLNDYDFIYVNDNIATQYGIDNTVPIHLIEDTLGTNYIDILESIGYIKTLINEYPDKKYLNFLGSKRIDIEDARQAKNFTLLQIDQTITETVLTKFISLYDQCREYYVNTLYMVEYRNVFDYYDNFIAMCIMVMTMQQFISRTMELSIRREFFDDYAVQLLYSVYGVPYNSKIDTNSQKAIVQNLNILIQNKATNKVIYDIASLLGFDRIEIFCYYLMKERRFTSDGRPVVATKIVKNEDTGELEEVYDYEAMFDVYFQKVEVNDYDYYQALEDPSNRVSYENVTSGDPYWWEDNDLYKEVWESEYNFKETKYLGVTISYKLTEIMYENIILLKMIMEKKSELEGIMVDLPKISESGKMNLFDTVVLLCALTCKKYHLNGEIVCKPSQTLHVLDTLNQMYEPSSAYDCLSFNFSKFLPENFDETTKEIFQYLDEDDQARFRKYVSILSVSGTSNADKVNALNDMYSNVKGLSKFLSGKIASATDIEEYRVFSKFYRAVFYSKATSDAFTVKTENSTFVPTTYMEYLQYTNPSVYDFIQTIDDDNLYSYINHVISAMESIIVNLEHLYIINDSTSSLQEVLLELIRFFKSYTTDLIGLNIVYIFDFKPDNMLKILDRMERIEKSISADDSINFSYADYLRLHANLHITNDLKLRDKPFLEKEISTSSNMCLSDKVKIESSNS